MRRFDVAREVDASPAAAWRALVDTSVWPAWGPSVRSAEIDGGGHLLRAGATGTVTTVVGLRLPFEVTDWSDGERWAWDVARVPATGHAVRPSVGDRCQVVFEVPWVAAPYAAVCRLALGRIADVLTATPG